MPKEFYTFEDYITENRYDNIEKNVDFSVVAPQFFHNGFNLGNGWFNRWTMKNNYQVETLEDDRKFLAVYDSMGKWIAAYHQYKGQIFTNRTLQQLHESAEIKDEDKIEESAINEASVAKLQKDHAKVVKQMADLAQEYKKDKGNSKIVDKLKELTKQKKSLEAALDAAISVLDDQYDESLQEKKDHIVVITTKDGKKHKSIPMEKAVADAAMKKMLKHPKKDMEGVEVLMIESVNETFEDSTLVDDLLESVYFKPLNILKSSSTQLNSMYESGEYDPESLNKILEDLNFFFEQKNNLSINDIDEDKLEKKVQELSKNYRVERNGYDLKVLSYGRIKSFLVFDFMEDPIDVYMDGKIFGSGIKPDIKAVLSKIMEWHKLVSKAKSTKDKSEREWLTSKSDLTN